MPRVMSFEEAFDYLDMLTSKIADDSPTMFVAARVVLDETRKIREGPETLRALIENLDELRKWLTVHPTMTPGEIAPREPGDYTINIIGGKFDPQVKLAVAAPARVRWKNSDSSCVHRVVGDDYSFDTGPIEPDGVSVWIQFLHAKAIHYHCLDDATIRGLIEVG